MSLSPTDILERLKQLKLWQESQEELLKKTKNIVNTSANITTASDYQTIEGLSAFDSSTYENSSKSAVNWESQVISPTKNFNQLLEEKLAEDPGPNHVTPVVKRPFLKKGAGLERFRLKPRQDPIKIKKNVKKSNRNVTPLRAPDLSIKPKATWTKVDNADEQVKKINAQLEESPAGGEQTLYEKQLERELLIFEALEQKANNSSFCSTNSSVMRILSSTPSKLQSQPPISEEKRVHWESQSEEEDVIETNLERKDIAEILLRLKTLADDTSKPKVPSIIEISEEERWSTTESSSDSASVTSTDLEATLKTETHDIAVGTNEFAPEDCVMCGDKIQKIISEYENKIRALIQDENKVIEVKRQLEQKEKDFLKKKREFEEERTDHLYEIEVEKKKLAKEKQAFQTYMKESQNRPNKRGRQEISTLKQEIADLTETLKLKETKSGLTQARLRNQIKQLEKENTNLKNEVEKLTKENAKLSASQKLNRKSSDAKILQEINKNINKLAAESLKTNKSEEKDTRKSLPPNNIILDEEDSFLEMRNIKNDLAVQYENTFRKQSVPEVSKTIDKVEQILDDGTRQVKYPNGNIKTVSPNGNLITIKYFNGDQQETNLLDGTINYYFSSKKICQTTYPDGLEVVEYPEGMIEKRYKNGKCEVILPDGVTQTTFPDGNQETKYTDGSIVKISKSGEKILLLPNGQKEVETKEFKRREYPDGTVKILYPNGTQETKYANGRVRIKDGNGTLLVDTQS